MMQELLRIADFIWKSIVHVWPYILITVPIAVGINMSGASKYISKVFNKKPIVSILLATAVGAFSPFCSCSVVPVIASLLIGGVPLAPVMSFWLASPSMDPEIFFLSVTVVGWKLAVWRLGSAFVMSLSAGLITQILVKKGWIREDATMKAHSYGKTKKLAPSLKGVFITIKKGLLVLSSRLWSLIRKNEVITSCGCSAPIAAASVYQSPVAQELCCRVEAQPLRISGHGSAKSKTCGCSDNSGLRPAALIHPIMISKSENFPSAAINKKRVFSDKLIKEIVSATTMVVKFMLLAYFLEALIVLYVPSEFVKSLLGNNNFLSIIWAALIGVPVYTNSIPALALVGGLITQGMAPASGLAFLISGPTTTIPAMAAVWNLATKKVFFLYIGFTLAAAVISGLLYQMVN
jgi:hypothetical protein